MNESNKVKAKHQMIEAIYTLAQVHRNMRLACDFDSDPALAQMATDLHTLTDRINKFLYPEPADAE